MLTFIQQIKRHNILPMNVRYFLIIFILCCSSFCIGQNVVPGTWEGRFLSIDIGLGQPKLVVEINDFKDSLFTGVSHLYYEKNKYEHYKIVGRYYAKDSMLVFKEVETIAVDLGKYSNCLGIYVTSLKKQGQDLVQTGIWEPNIRGCSSTTNVWLQRRPDPVKLLPPPVKKPVVTTKPADKKPAQKSTAVIATTKNKRPVPVSINAPVTTATKKIPEIKRVPVAIPQKIKERETDVQSLIEIASADKDSIKVEVYDNGEIDGDSVSVYEDEQLRINHKLITAKPITFYISLQKNVNPISHLRLVAESLGSIPPCTALMIVTTKSKRYEVHLSSNYKTNATVELFLKE